MSNVTETTVAGETLFPEAEVLTLSLIVISISIFIFGLVGNILSFLVFSKKSMRGSTLSIFVRFLAISDTICILFGVSVNVRGLLGIISVNQIILRYIFCSLFFHGTFAFGQISSWLVVAMTIDRSIHVLLPTKSRILSTKFRAKIACSVIFIVPILGYSFLYFAFDKIFVTVDPYNKWSTSLYCQGKNENFETFMYKSLGLMDVILFSLAPALLITIFNVLIINNLIAARKERAKMTKDVAQSDRKSNQMTLMLLFVSSYLMISTLPIGIISLYLQYSGVWQSASVKETNKLIMISRVLNTFAVTNNAINFYLYCLSGQKFRKELNFLFSKSKKAENSQTISTLS